MARLQIRNFAQIDSADIEFGDLTVLVGPQATGKSLILQWMKFALDANEVVHSLREAGHDVRTASARIDLIFGHGMASAWNDSSSVHWDGKIVPVKSKALTGRKDATGKVFYIPAHRALLLAEGWPAPFMKLNADTPVVARLFSQNLYLRFSSRQSSQLFPVERILKREYRDLLDKAVFHGGTVELDKQGLRYSLRLRFEQNKAELPFMTWTSGQREFTPLLLGLYHVLPSRKRKKVRGVDWVIVEEPEMGLHPQAIAVFMLLVLDMLWRGYKVVLSTHSPLVLDVVWAIRQLAANRASWKLLCAAFRAQKSKAMQDVLAHAMSCQYRVHFMEITDTTGRVTSRDISGLDPGSTDQAEADWGGLTGFSSRFGEAVRESVVAAEQLELPEVADRAR